MARRSRYSRRGRYFRRALKFVRFLLLLALAAGLVFLLTRCGKKPENRDAVNAPQPTVAATAVPEEPAVMPEAEPTAVLEPTYESAPEPTPEPEPTPAPAPAEPENALEDAAMPIYVSSETEEKVIAVTVDDCFQADALKGILDVCKKYDAKITLFPIGKNLSIASVAEQIVRAHDMGMEIENHTFNHSKLHTLSDEDMAAEIYSVETEISKVLGVRYRVHFLRTLGGDNRHDPRTHAYMAKIGYLGMAHWSVIGTEAKLKDIEAALEPGAVYLFHANAADYQNLKDFIPYAVGKGYQLLTMNELFGLPDNETSPLPDAGSDYYTVPSPGRYTGYLTHTIKDGATSWDTYMMQKRLLELGYLQYSKPTGFYGKTTEQAVHYFQLQHGLPRSGELDQATLEALYASDAQRIAQKTIDRMESELGIQYKDYSKR